MRKLSLFSGIGGIDLAAHWAGMKTVAFCEREPFPQQVLRKHWPNIPIYDDVCKLTRARLEQDGIIGPGRAIDIISAGYPCQPESVAGKRRGKEDDRWLWPEVKRLLEEIRPYWFLGENVFGHVSMGLDTVLSDLESIGYTAEAIVIPSAAVGAPHRRDRVFIVGYTERSRCSRESRRRSEQQSSDGCIELEKRALADSSSKGLQRQQWQEHEGSGSGFANCCEDVADSTSFGQSGSGKSIESIDQASCRDGQTSKSLNVCIGKEWTTESSMGGVLDGLSDWLDRHRWPAALGQEQYDWEPARVATGVKNRVGRLKGLGNAVNPYQVYPILAAIKYINQGTCPNREDKQ